MCLTQQGIADAAKELEQIKREETEALEKAQEYAGAFGRPNNPDSGDNDGDE